MGKFKWQPPKVPTLRTLTTNPFKDPKKSAQGAYDLFESLGDPANLKGNVTEGIKKLFGGKKAPEREVIGTDPQTSGLIDERIKQSQRTPQEYAQELNQDAEGGLAAMQSDQGAAQEQASMGGESPLMGDAIRSKFNQVANKDLMRLKNKNELRANLNKSQDMRKAWDMHMARQNIMTMNYEKLFKANSDAANARAQALGQAFNVAGYGAGMYFGSQKGKQQTPSYGGQNSWGLQTETGLESTPNDASGYGSAGESGSDYSNLA